MIIGIDFGNTIVQTVKRHGERKEFPNAIKVITKMAEKHPIHIISKVDERQMIEVKRWLRDNLFFERTGIPRDHLHFCAERRDKNEICLRLKVTHHIDDRPEVVAFLSNDIKGYLFRPVPKDVVKFFHSLRNACIVQSWKEIEDMFLL